MVNRVVSDGRIHLLKLERGPHPKKKKSSFCVVPPVKPA